MLQQVRAGKPKIPQNDRTKDLYYPEEKPLTQSTDHKKQRILMSLKRKTLIMLVCLLLSFSMVFVLSTYIIRTRSEKDYRESSSETAVNNVVSSIEFYLEKYNYISRLIMVNDKVVEFLHVLAPDNNQTYEAKMGIYEIVNLYSSISYIDSVYVFRLDGKSANTGHVNYAIDPGVEEYQRILDARGSVVLAVNGNGLIRRIDKNPTLTLSRAIYDINTQKLIGVLLINISGDVFSNAISLQRDCEMCVLDKYGNLLSGDSSIAEMYDPAFVSKSMIHRELNNGAQIITGQSVADSFVVLCSSGNSENAMPKETRIALWLTLITFAISFIVIAVFISINITKPIENLNSAMEKTQSSGWLKRIEEETPNNEIGRLAESYNSMIDYLNELFNRLIEEEKNMRNAEMRVLHEQIKPHFLYNTLETISYMAVEENAERVHDALETLGSFYRNSLSKGEREIPLRREIQIIRDYLSLQKLRYGENINDEYDIDEASLDVKIPKLTLQPLVENSIYHGVRLKGEPCVIRVSSRMEEDGLHVFVYDSGVGMSQDKIDEVLNTSKTEEKDGIHGFGLKGTIDRIRYYSEREAVVNIRSEEGEFTEIELIIRKNG